MVRQATLYAMVVFLPLMYTLMGWIPMASIASTTERYSHSPPTPRFSVIPVIYCAVQWWKPSSTLSISPVTTHISLTYKITDCTTALYIYPQVCTGAPVLSITLSTIPHRLRAFRRFW